MQKKSKKWIYSALHRGHDDSHRVMMRRLDHQGIGAENLKQIHSIMATMAHKAHYKNYK
jgi:hypothetical protein